MKNSLLGLIAIVLFSFNTKAQGKSDFNQKSEFIHGSVITSFNKEIIEYKFKSLDELNEGLDEIVEEFDFNGFEKETSCEMKIEIKLELTSGVTKILISEIIRTSCGNESRSAATKRLKTMLLAASS